MGSRLRLFLGVLSLGSSAPGCGAENEPPGERDAISRAKTLYTACVEEKLGMAVTRLDVSASGDISVEFGAGYTDQKGALALAICEPLIEAVLDGEGVPVVPPPPNLGMPGSDAEVAALLAERAHWGFQGAVLAEFEGMPRVDRGFGRLAPGSAQSPNADSAFDCGSIMKQITAVSVFLLEESRLLSRDQALAEFFPAAPDRWRSVTVQQVLTHSAGFGEYHDTEGDFEAMDRATALDRIFEQTPLFEPGTESAYSNSGYTLLAALIEVVTGEAYGVVVRERVFEPLGMSRSGLYGDPLWADGNVAVGSGGESFESNDPSRWPAPSWALIGNGGLVSTLNDLMRFAKALDGGPLFEPATRDALQRDYVARARGSLAGKQVIAYAGANDFGFDVLVAQVPEHAAYVLAASHVQSPVNAELVGLEVLQVLSGQPFQYPEDD